MKFQYKSKHSWKKENIQPLSHALLAKDMEALAHLLSGWKVSYLIGKEGVHFQRTGKALVVRERHHYVGRQRGEDYNSGFDTVRYQALEERSLSQGFYWEEIDKHHWAISKMLLDFEVEVRERLAPGSEV